MSTLATAPGVLGAALTTYITAAGNFLAVNKIRHTKQSEMLTRLQGKMDSLPTGKEKRVSIFLLKSSESQWM